MTQLIDDDVIKSKVDELWSKVFQESNRVLKQADDYGFLGIERIPSPNIHQILLSLKVFDALIDILLANADVAALEYDQERQLLNAKSQLVRMGRLAAALRANNREDYEKAVEELQQQAVI